MGEEGLRQQVVSQPKPVYPASSLRNGAAGIAVVKVEVRADGRIDDLTVLEAPDAAIAEAVESSVWQWTFYPFSGSDTSSRIQSKLTFYFEIEEGVGRVLSPDEKRRRNKG